jgi:hypothetical protein
VHKSIPRDKRKMSYRINIFKWIISHINAGAIDGLNLYVYVGNNPLKYIDPIGHFPLISWDRFVHKVNAYKKNQRDLNTFVFESANSVTSSGVKCG